MSKRNLSRDTEFYSKFWLTDGCTALAVATRNHKLTGRAPHTSLASRSMSRPALLLRDARCGDMDAEAELLAHLVTQIENYAKHEKWRLDANKFIGFGRVVLKAYVTGGTQSTGEAAKIVGVSQAAYFKNWQPKIFTASRCVRQWESEIRR